MTKNMTGARLRALRLAWAGDWVTPDITERRVRKIKYHALPRHDRQAMANLRAENRHERREAERTAARKIRKPRLVANGYIRRAK